MITTHRESGYVTKIQSGTHALVSDVPPALGGADTGPDPHALLEAALGACTTITVQMYANRKGWPLEGCDTEVRFAKEDKEGIVLERKISIRGPLDAEQKKRLFEIAEKCPIHQVLVRGAKVESTLAN